MNIRIYLAGAIRNDNPQDIAWREDFIRAMDGLPVDVLNPLGGKTYDPETKTWKLFDVDPVAKVIVPHDFFCVDTSHIVVFNLRALAERYPNIGTLIEFGRATKAGCLIYSVVEPGYSGHNNAAMFTLHPFIEHNSSVVFTSVEACAEFTRRNVGVLSGASPHFSGYRGRAALAAG